MLSNNLSSPLNGLNTCNSVYGAWGVVRKIAGLSFRRVFTLKFVTFLYSFRFG